MKIVGHGANAVQEGNVVVIRCKAGHLVASKFHKEGDPVVGMQMCGDGTIKVGGITVKPPGLKCRKCGEVLLEFER